MLSLPEKDILVFLGILSQRHSQEYLLMGFENREKGFHRVLHLLIILDWYGIFHFVSKQNQH